MTKQELTSLITRLEEEYGENAEKKCCSGLGPFGRCGRGTVKGCSGLHCKCLSQSCGNMHYTDCYKHYIHVEHVPSNDELLGHIPLLLSALKHYMAVAEAVGVREARYQEIFSWLLGEIGEFPNVTDKPHYRFRTELRERLAALDTPSLLNDKT